MLTIHLKFMRTADGSAIYFIISDWTKRKREGERKKRRKGKDGTARVTVGSRDGTAD